MIESPDILLMAFEHTSQLPPTASNLTLHGWARFALL